MLGDMAAAKEKKIEMRQEPVGTGKKRELINPFQFFGEK